MLKLEVGKTTFSRPKRLGGYTLRWGIRVEDDGNNTLSVAFELKRGKEIVGDAILLGNINKLME